MPGKYDVAMSTKSYIHELYGPNQIRLLERGIVLLRKKSPTGVHFLLTPLWSVYILVAVALSYFCFSEIFLIHFSLSISPVLLMAGLSLIENQTQAIEINAQGDVILYENEGMIQHYPSSDIDQFIGMIIYNEKRNNKKYLRHVVSIKLKDETYVCLFTTKKKVFKTCQDLFQENLGITIASEEIRFTTSYS
jgi:hypothetical protein